MFLSSSRFQDENTFSQTCSEIHNVDRKLYQLLSDQAYPRILICNTVTKLKADIAQQILLLSDRLHQLQDGAFNIERLPNLMVSQTLFSFRAFYDDTNNVSQTCSKYIMLTHIVLILIMAIFAYPMTARYQAQS